MAMHRMTLAACVVLVASGGAFGGERMGGAETALQSTVQARGGETMFILSATVPGAFVDAGGDKAGLPDVVLAKGFSELGSTPSGRAIFSNFTDVKSVNDLIQHVGDAMGGMFGDKPRFGSAAVNAKDRNGGVATFSATVKGQAIKGIVLFGVNPAGTSSATVVYVRTDAPAEEFKALMETVPAQPKMHTEQMPDGSGSIDIPEGWKCVSQSMTAGAIFVAGPTKDVGMLVNMKYFVDLPDGTQVKTVQRLYNSQMGMYRMLRAKGIRANPPEPWQDRLKMLTIAPFVGPEEAFTKVLPMFNDKQRQAGKTWAEYGEITGKQKASPAIPGDEALVIGTTIRWHNGEKVSEAEPLMMRVETSRPGATGTWVLHVDMYSAPKAEAMRDFQLMGQIYSSINIPQAAINRQLDKDNKAFQAMSAYFQAKNDALLARGRQFQVNQKQQFERFENQQAAQAQARHDSCSDMIESCLGVRDVLDTSTGQMHQVDLYNSTGITNTLNGLANDPNRFVQIPLRYER